MIWIYWSLLVLIFAAFMYISVKWFLYFMIIYVINIIHFGYTDEMINIVRFCLTNVIK